MKVTIIGAGLSGLLTGYYLHSAGIDFQVLEARDRIGGRIMTVRNDTTQVEMGATWLGDQHLRLKELLSELGISIFRQYQDGKAVFESTSMAPVQVFDLPANQPASYRIAGGSDALINTVFASLPENSVKLNAVVSKIEATEGRMEVILKSGLAYRSDLVISTLPPSLLASDINMVGKIPKEMTALCLNTHTWMGNSIKFAVTYQQAFWRLAGYAGVGFSNAGIASEIHDHVNDEQNKFALKGFLVPGAIKLEEEKRKQLLIGQLIRFFGPEAGNYLRYDEVLWAHEEFTLGSSHNDLVPHQNNGHPLYNQPMLEDRLLISGSETSPAFGGYMEGAVFAAQAAANWAGQHS